MDRTLTLFAIGLVFGGGVGFTLAASNGVTLDGHDHGLSDGHAAMTTASAGHAAGGGDHARMHSQPIMLAAAEAPDLTFSVTPDPISGHNLQVVTQGFTFAPQHASGAHVAGEGHAHIYVNGAKLARLYGPWLHLPALPKGEVTVEVTLTANDHRPLMVDGEAITAREVFHVE